MAQENRKSLAELQKQAVVEKMWLNYYNNTLRDMKIINLEQHRKMKIQINSRRPPMER